MKKLTLGMLTLCSLVIAGCSNDGVEEPKVPKFTVATYQPSLGIIPVPNDLLFNGTQDLTLNLPVADPNDYSDPTVALSGLDGWSTVAPFAIDFSNPEANVTLNPSTVVPGQTVRMFEVLADTDYNNPLFGAAPTFAPYQLVRELSAGTEFVALAQGMSVAVVPTKPLTPRATYLVVATKGIADSNNNPVVEDGQYEIVSGSSDLTGTSLAALTPVQTLVNTYEALATAGGVTAGDVAISFAFTTQSVGVVEASAKGLYIDSIGVPPTTSFSSLMMDTTNITGIGAADLYKGTINLNYYLSAPSANNPLAPLNAFWKAADMVPVGGQMVPNPLAGGHLTYVNSLPQVTGVETAPLMVSMPKASLGCAKPAAGYPVMIFQHGITSNRTAMLGIADTMAAPPLCTAVVSMDMPLHGIDANNSLHLALQAASSGMLGLFEGYTSGGLRERTFGVDYIDNTTGAPGPDGTPDSSGAHTINLQNLLVSRDNLRQAIMDLLTLEKAIPAMDIDGGGPDFDVNKLYFMGHSLGGIVGSSYVAYSDSVKTAILANPGGGIAGLLDASDTFGPRIRAGLSAAGVDPASPDYQAFLVAAQTAIDSGDPINTTTAAIANNVPTLMLRTEGDAVVPNNSPVAPLSGTDPLAAYLGLTTITASNPGDVFAGSRLISRINVGNHGTVLSPAGANGATEFLNVTQEMQTHIATFIGSGGAAVTVTDPTLRN